MEAKRVKEVVIQKRRDVVSELYFVRRVPVTEIVESFVKDGQDWSERTIWNDIAALRKDLQKTINERKVNELVRRRVATHDKIIRRMWQNYDKEEIDPAIRVRILKDIDSSESNIIRDLQELGVVLRPESEVAIQITEGLMEGYKRVLARKKAIEREEELKQKAIENVQNKS